MNQKKSALTIVVLLLVSAVYAFGTSKGKQSCRMTDSTSVGETLLDTRTDQESIQETSSDMSQRNYIFSDDTWHLRHSLV